MKERPPTADVDVDAPEFVHIFGGAAAGERVGLGHGRHQLQVQLLGDGLEGPDVGERGERVEDGDLQDLTLEVERVGHRIAVDVHRGDAAVDKLDVDLGHTQLVGHLAHRLLEGAALDRLERGGDVGLGDPGLGLGAGHGHGGAEAAHLLAGDAHHRLARDRPAHVLGLGEGSITVVDHALDVGDRPRLHVGERLAHLADADDDARSLLPLHHQRLDELGADVEDGVVAVELVAAPQQGKLLASDHRASSSRADRKAAIAWERRPGSPSPPRPKPG